jgi:hypothetical protein
MIKPKAINREKLVAFVLPINPYPSVMTIGVKQKRHIIDYRIIFIDYSGIL